MEEIKTLILKAMEELKVSDSEGSNMYVVAEKVGTHFEDTEFQEILDKLIEENRIKFINDVNAVITQ